MLAVQVIHFAIASLAQGLLAPRMNQTGQDAGVTTDGIVGCNARRQSNVSAVVIGGISESLHF